MLLFIYSDEIQFSPLKNPFPIAASHLNNPFSIAARITLNQHF
jgi:hypothetical protein